MAAHGNPSIPTATTSSVGVEQLSGNSSPKKCMEKFVREQSRCRWEDAVMALKVNDSDATEAIKYLKSR